MVAEPWIMKMGNQVSSNLRNPSKKPSSQPKVTIGILSFEVANVLSKTVHLHKSLSHSEISKLKAEIFSSEGVKNLVSDDETFLLELALAEKLDDLNRVANVVSRLGKKCVEPALQGFEHVYGDIVNGVIDVRELGFLVKDMDSMVKKMERYVNATSNLYSEMEVLNELEQTTKKFQQNQHEESRRAFEQKLIWQRQDIRQLKEVSLWNQTYDRIVEFLARTICTIYARICVVFGESVLQLEINRSQLFSTQLRRAVSRRNSIGSQSGGISNVKSRYDSKRGGEVRLFCTEDVIFPCGTSPGKLFTDCLSLSSSGSKFDDDDSDGGGGGGKEEWSSQVSGSCSVGGYGGGLKRGSFNQAHSGVPFSGDPRQARSGVVSNAGFSPKGRLTVYAPPSTVGGSALALHYANVIIVIEKLLRYPHLVGEEARDDLYQMLPTSLRLSLRTNLKSYVKNLAIYDAPLAHDWKETLDRVLKWLAPLAHNMIRWQSERNFEQHQIVSRSNVLLLQTLYFADRGKTEAAICELLVGLNYICRFEQQQNALLDCASSFDLEDCMQWQMQCRASFFN